MKVAEEHINILKTLEDHDGQLKFVREKMKSTDEQEAKIVVLGEKIGEVNSEATRNTHDLTASTAQMPEFILQSQRQQDQRE